MIVNGHALRRVTAARVRAEKAWTVSKADYALADLRYWRSKELQLQAAARKEALASLRSAAIAAGL